MKRKGRFHTKRNFYFLIHGFNLQIWKRGDLFPITKASHSYIFLSTLVNDTQGLMCLKNRSNFNCKLHPRELEAHNGSTAWAEYDTFK